MKSLHQRLSLYLDEDNAYIFVPTDPVGPPSLTIHRNSGEIILNRPGAPLPASTHRFEKSVYGILGIISLSLSDYVIVITGRGELGRLFGHTVYRATEFEILPINPNISSTQAITHPAEAHLLALVRSNLNSSNLLLSYGFNITRRLQSQWETEEVDENKPAWELADDRFFWNRYLQQQLIETVKVQDLDSYILPVMFGTFDLRVATIRGRHFQLCLISRRSRFRAGTRYFRRGIDHDGHVANFNETEQLVIIEASQAAVARSFEDIATKMSFVQTRGSVPVFWSEITTLRYKPDLQVMDLQETADALRTHLYEQVQIYGEQALVNLVNQKGHEQPVKEAYERYMAKLSLPNVKYEYFDFHNECKKMRWDRIELLTNKLEPDLLRQGYLHLEGSNPVPVKLQTGTVRTNCMDNLDRTNVVQAFLAKRTLNHQLISVGILPEHGSIDDYESLASDFRELWANHADAIAMAYGGSGALKSDFTRTNKRTKKGLLEDGIKSMIRYLKNNYFDGPRQDAFDLITGVFVPSRGPAASMFLVTDSRPLVLRSVPHIAGFALFMIFAGLTLPRTSDWSLFYYFTLWFVILFLSVAFMRVHGLEYVSWPKLIPPTDAIYYSGPGFRSAHHGKGFRMSALNVVKYDPLVTKWGRQRAMTNGTRMDEVEMGTKRHTD